MPSIRQGSIHLFRVAGIDLFLHWSWFLVAVIEIQLREGRYTSVIWSIFEYLALFLIVLTHEFGHALACRQIGGTANRIMLWPFGGVAYVDPPQRPGAMLWSIAAGPLVNVALIPILGGAFVMVRMMGWPQAMPDAYHFVRAVLGINVGLLIFNILPIYPLDGGQILRSLLWFPLGRARSLMVAAVVGIIGIIGFIGLAVFSHQTWFGLISVYLLVSCWGGLKHAQVLLKMARIPRRPGFNCPSCRTAPPAGAYWKCNTCEQPFDTFLSQGVCPNCSARFAQTVCLDCQHMAPINDWAAQPIVTAGVLNGGVPVR
jgi:Zn-dependent protease